MHYERLFFLDHICYFYYIYNLYNLGTVLFVHLLSFKHFIWVVVNLEPILGH